MNYQTVTVVRTTRDRFGDTVDNGSHDITGCLVYPRTSTEVTDGADTVITGRTILTPPAADVLATDRIRLAGEPDGSARWEVVGDVGDWGVGMQVDIQRATG